MEPYWKLALITTALLALSFLGIAIKIWTGKSARFLGSCASENPMLKEAKCALCHYKKSQACENLP